MSRRHALSFHLTPVPQGSAVTFIHSVKSDLQRRVGLLASARLVVSSNEMGRSVNGRSALCRSCANRTDFNLENEIYPVHQPGSFGSAPTTIQLRSASLALLDRFRLLVARVGSLPYAMIVCFGFSMVSISFNVNKTKAKTDFLVAIYGCPRVGMI